MWAWFFQTIWHALFGLVLLVVAFGGSVVFIARAIAESTKHDQATCDCVDCQRRRVVAFERRRQKERRLDPRFDRWVSTIELKIGMWVEAKDNVYEVKNVQVEPSGYLVELRNVSTNGRSIVTMSIQNASRKVWRKVER